MRDALLLLGLVLSGCGSEGDTVLDAGDRAQPDARAPIDAPLVLRDAGTIMVGDVVTRVRVEGSGTGFVSFGQVLAAGHVPPGRTLVATDPSGDALPTQLDVRARYADGSARHAIVTFAPTGGTTYELRSAEEGELAPRTVAELLAANAGPIVEVVLTGGLDARVTLRELLESASARAPGGLAVLEAGPDLLGVAVARDLDTHLRVTFHVRWYGDGHLACDVSFENGYGTESGMGDRSYHASITMGETSYDADVEHYNHSAWHRVLTTEPDLYPRQDAAYLIGTGAFPNYDLARGPSDEVLDELRADVMPMDPGDHTRNQDETGFQDALGILPRWDALYLTSDCDARAYRAMLANADGGMAFAAAWNDAATGEPIRIDDHPRRSYADPEGSTPAWPSGAFSSASPLTISGSSHTPSIGFTAYAATGWYGHLRSMAHQAAYLVMWVAHGNRRDGGASADWYRETLRGQGWTYRSVGQAAWILPDDHPLKAYFTAALESAAARDASLYGAAGTERNPLGCMYMAEGNDEYRVFFHDFFVQAAAYVALDLGFESVRAVAAYAAGFDAGRLGSDGGFPFEFAPAYTMTVGPDATNFFSTFGELAGENVPAGARGLASGSAELARWLGENEAEHTGLVGELARDMGSPGYYYANLQPAASYLERLGYGAEPWARIESSGRWPAYGPTPQFSIVPR